MSYKSEIASNNESLRAVLDTVNSLPDNPAGAAPDLCSVTIETLPKNSTFYAFSRYVDGAIVGESCYGVGTISFNDVVCGSAIYLMTAQGYAYNASGSFTRIWNSAAGDSMSHVAGVITASPGGSVSFGWAAT